MKDPSENIRQWLFDITNSSSITGLMSFVVKCPLYRVWKMNITLNSINIEIYASYSG